MAKKRPKKQPELGPLPGPAMSLADLMAALDLTDGAFLPMIQLPAPLPTPPETIPTPPGGFRQADAMRARKALIELRLRQMEALRLYEPLPRAEEFHADLSRVRLAIGSNQSSKTTAVLAEAARAVTNQDPHGKWPQKGKFYIVGHTLDQIGRVLYPKLFKPGEIFDIIKDEKTGQWRTFKPWLDAHREHEKRPSPALIPKRLVELIAWKDKKANIPDRIVLKTGWEMCFFSSEGIPPQGDAIDGWLIDEECKNEGWVGELMARILRKSGKGMWSACPQVGNPSLFELHVQAEEEKETLKPRVSQFHFLLEDNPYVPQEMKDDLAATLTPEEARIRIGGEFRQSGFRVYPEFDMKIHGYEGDGWQVPSDWSRYLVVDPGRQVCAVLFAAVPPHNRMVLLYDELYLKQCNAEMFGRMVATKSQGIVYERMLIDSHAGRVADMGYGVPVDTQYAAALKRHKVESKIGYCFMPGNDDPDAGILKVRSWMHNPPVGGPKLRVLNGRLHNFQEEIKRYHYQAQQVRGATRVTDKPDKRNDHLCDALRYLAMFEPRWAKPKKAAALLSPAVRALNKKRADEKQSRRSEGGSGAIRLGPSKRAAA